MALGCPFKKDFGHQFVRSEKFGCSYRNFYLKFETRKVNHVGVLIWLGFEFDHLSPSLFEFCELFQVRTNSDNYTAMIGYEPGLAMICPHSL